MSKAQQRFDLEIRPVDTLMFRDGRPFNQGDPGAAEAVSVFPPYPNTVSGMVRALIGKKDGLRVSAPRICFAGRGPLFPTPLSILTQADGTCVRLIPATVGVETDLGDATRLPEPQLSTDEHAGSLKEIEDRWITLGGLEKVLRGDIPEAIDFELQKALWESEARVGIGIDNMSDGAGDPVSNLDKRRPINGALYAATHTRLANGVTLRVTVEARKDGDRFALDLPAFGPAGGEHRMAEFNACDPPPLPTGPTLIADGDIVRFTIYHAAPCFLHPLPAANTHFRKVPTIDNASTACLAEATVVSACLGKALMIGGWNLKDKEPSAMRPAIPAGSVWFLEAPKKHAPEIAKLHGKRIGEKLGLGYGEIFIGAWGSSHLCKGQNK